MKRFELWLDESGAFEEQAGSEELYSFVGGVLVESDRVKNYHFGQLLSDKTLNHAMRMTSKQKKSYVLPVLQQFKQETEARYVYFENIEYRGHGDNRMLYLQVFAEGLLQLIQLLDAKYGAVQLDLTLASRTASKVGYERRIHITEKEYRQVFQQLVKANKERNEYHLSTQTTVSFHLDKATENPKLILADFASNIRRTYKRGKSLRDAKSRVLMEEIFAQRYAFSMSELSSDIKIRVLLSKNDVSEALQELFLSPTLEHRSDYLDLVLERLSHLSYRIIKSQLKQFAAEILAFVARQDKYLETIELLKQILTDLLPVLKEAGYPYVQVEMELILHLSDVYLRSGQFQEAQVVLSRGENLLAQADNTLEHAVLSYRLLEKKAVFYVDSFQYKKASDLMREVREFFALALEIMDGSSPLIGGQGNLQSEYYGDILCMEIYAYLFQRAEEIPSVEDLRRLSDLGLSQYPPFEGELERHRQYRSRLEARAGCYQEAVDWLLAAIHERHVFHTDVSVRQLTTFWDVVLKRETEISQLFYLTYYSLLLSRMAEARHEWAGRLWTALKEHPIYQLLYPQQPDKKEVQLLGSNRANCHPLEIIYWNLGDYHYYQGDLKQGLVDYQRAVNVCQANPQTLSLQLRLLPLLAAQIHLEMRHHGRAPSHHTLQACLHSLTEQVNGLAHQGSLDVEETRAYLADWRKAVTQIRELTEETSRQLWDLAHQWRY